MARELSNLYRRVRFRNAAAADIPLLRHWDEQPHVNASDPNEDWWDWEREFSHDPPWRELLIAELDGRPVGFLQIIDPAGEETHYWGDIGAGFRALDIWIGEAADLGRGIGSEMMRQTIARCFADPAVHTILVDPLMDNTRAHRFYERHGFRREEERRFGEDDCLVMSLTRQSA